MFGGCGEPGELSLCWVGEVVEGRDERQVVVQRRVVFACVEGHCDLRHLKLYRKQYSKPKWPFLFPKKKNEFHKYFIQFLCSQKTPKCSMVLIKNQKENQMVTLYFRGV